MEHEQILIPEGWTYFAHRTNTSKWETNPFEGKSITLTKLMSVVTERDIYEELRKNGFEAPKGYSLGEGEPFEIRCLICAQRYLNQINDSKIKEIILKEFYYDKNNFGGAYGHRHHSIPRGEELVIIGFSDYDEVYDREANIIWTIPRRLLEFYNQELDKGEVRGISLKRFDLLTYKSK